MNFKNQLFAVAFVLVCLVPFSGFAVNSASEVDLARTAIQHAMAQVDMKKGDAGVLLLTNAYYGQIKGQGAEQFRDLLSEMTGCTSGRRSLLDVHTPVTEQLWFSLCKKATNKLVFCRWQDGSFQSQSIDITPEKILEVEAWKKASSGIIGPETLFQVASISLGWTAGTDWSILKVTSFHGELPPGVNIGYLFHTYLKKNMPLKKGDEMLFFGALPKCYMDTLQIVYNATLGKMQAYGALMSKEQLSKYATKGAMPCIVALKVNRKEDLCEGMVLGFSRKQVMDDLGVREADLNSKGGASDPVFCIARIQGCRQMAKKDPEHQLKWVVELRKFSGKAKDLVNPVCNAGADPYAVIWSK